MQSPQYTTTAGGQGLIPQLPIFQGSPNVTREMTGTSGMERADPGRFREGEVENIPVVVRQYRMQQQQQQMDSAILLKPLNDIPDLQQRKRHLDEMLAKIEQQLRNINIGTETKDLTSRIQLMQRQKLLEDYKHELEEKIRQDLLNKVRPPPKSPRVLAENYAGMSDIPVYTEHVTTSKGASRFGGVQLENRQVLPPSSSRKPEKNHEDVPLYDYIEPREFARLPPRHIVEEQDIREREEEDLSFDSHHYDYITAPSIPEHSPPVVPATVPASAAISKRPVVRSASESTYLEPIHGGWNRPNASQSLPKLSPGKRSQSVGWPFRLDTMTFVLSDISVWNMFNYSLFHTLFHQLSCHQQSQS